MKAKTSADYQREYRRRLREQGLVKKEVWIHPSNAKQLSVYERQLRLNYSATTDIGEDLMSAPVTLWTTTTLFKALCEQDLFVSGLASIELIDGLEPALHIVMTEYGDLPVFLTVSGEQVVVESILWSTADVVDIARFNQTILKTHKYFPLSTISLDNIGKEEDYYHMFGALSATSLIHNIVFEIEVLASNVIHATEAYSEFLSIDIATA